MSGTCWSTSSCKEDDMRRKRVLVSIVLGALLVGGTSFAQQGGSGSQMPQMPHGGQGGTCSMMTCGACPMMGGGMHGGMMGMGQTGNSPQALQMRGEMMKAMGD